MTSIPIFLRSIKNRPALLAFLSAALFITLLCLAFDPRWRSNDDVAMSMIAHGYGIAAYGSPNLVFSNVLWGYIVRAIPSLNGVLGYSIATITVLLVIGSAMLYFLLRLGIGYLVGLLAIILLITRPILFPQFTINAGLLTLTSIIGWQVYARIGGQKNLLLACLLAFFGYLIRDTEFLLVLGIALPLLPWKALREQRQMQAALLLLAAAIVMAATFDYWSYTGSEWQQFKELNTVRIPFTDYGAGEYLKQRPEIIARQGYSSNDIDLISNWFFIDSQIANSQSMSVMLNELGPIFNQLNSLNSGLVALKFMLSPVLLPILLSAAIFLALMPRWSVVFVWLLCLTALFVIGVLGRPGILRIYSPLVSLLFTAPFLASTFKVTAKKWVIILILFVVCVANTYLSVPQAFAYKQLIEQTRQNIRDIPSEPIISWGWEQSFPFELVYPVLTNNIDARNIKIYSLDTFTRTPYSIASAEQEIGRNMLNRLQMTDGIPIMASPRLIKLLHTYCSEHLKGQFYEMTTYQTAYLLTQRVRCMTEK